MKITEIKLYTIRAGNLGERGADVGESQYWGGGWATQSRIANPMSVHPAYAATRTLWMGAGQDPYAIEIYTDEGVTGVAANYGGGPFSCAVIQKHLSRFLIGADPFNIELLWDQMYRVTAPYGLGAITSMAISGVDLALWDLMGKALGQPVYRLLGGRTKASIPLYVTVHPDQAACWKDRGFMGIKIAAPWGIADGRSGLRKMEKCVADTRLAIGDDLDLMIDCYMSWGFEFTIKMAERVRDFDVLWFEDPLPNGYVDKMYSNLRPRISPVLIANGNMEFNYKAFESLMVAGATDVIQPEMQWCGGLTAVRRIAAAAKARDIPVIPHGAGAYNYHFVLSNTNSPYAEFLAVGDGTELRPVFDSLIGEPLPVNGHVDVSDRPGFGVELHPDFLVPFAVVA
jgi:L-rhamnonate dehydratase